MNALRFLFIDTSFAVIYGREVSTVAGELQPRLSASRRLLAYASRRRFLLRIAPQSPGPTCADASLYPDYCYKSSVRKMTTSTQQRIIPYSGFILAFEPRRTATVTDKLSWFNKAVEPFSAVDWKFERREVVLLALNPGEPSIGGAALMQRMHGSAGTAKLKMRLSDPVLFDRRIRSDELEGLIDLPANISTAEHPKRLDPFIWSTLIGEIKRLRPQHADELESLLNAREEERRLFGGDVRTTRLVEQRDAVGITLDIAKADRQKVFETFSTTKVADARSVLDLLDNEPLHEQDVIRHDQKAFAGLLSDSLQKVRFRGRGSQVRVYVEDKKPLETVLGTDLLIFQEKYSSFLLIQYKNMERIETRTGSTWSCRVDQRMRVQIRKMQRGLEAIGRQPAAAEGIADWRLHESPFYFKLCETTRLNARDDSLVSGIILGVEHLDRFIAHLDAEGGQRGVRVGYHNCPRYLNNTEFIALARGGWIGCGPRGYNLIRSVLAAGKRGGRRAMFAVIEGTLSTGAGDRRWAS